MEQELLQFLKFRTNVRTVFFVKYRCAWKVINMRCIFDENLYFLDEDPSFVKRHRAIGTTYITNGDQNCSRIC